MGQEVGVARSVTTFDSLYNIHLCLLRLYKVACSHSNHIPQLNHPPPGTCSINILK